MHYCERPLDGSVRLCYLLSSRALSLVRSSRSPPTCLINVNTNTAGDSGPGCNKHRRHESPLCLSNQSPRQATSCMFTPHTRKLPASWHLVSWKDAKGRKKNPCGAVRNYFHLGCWVEFVAFGGQTLALVFSKFLCVCARLRWLSWSSCHLAVVSKSCSPPSPPPPPPPLLFFSFSSPFSSPFSFPLSSRVPPALYSILFQSGHRSRWIGDNLRCALFSPWHCH